MRIRKYTRADWDLAVGLGAIAGIVLDRYVITGTPPWMLATVAALLLAIHGFRKARESSQ